MKTQNIIFTLSVVLFLHTHSAAQCTLTGIIDKASGEPIAYANIALYNAKDSVLVSGTITSDKGEFLAGNLKIGKYNVKISFIGYQAVVIDNILLQPGTRDLGETELLVLSENLDEITVKSTKPPLTYKVDRRCSHRFTGKYPVCSVGSWRKSNLPRRRNFQSLYQRAPGGQRGRKTSPAPCFTYR